MRAIFLAVLIVLATVTAPVAQISRSERVKTYMVHLLFKQVVNKIRDVVRNTHPSVLGAKGTADLLIENFPVIQQHLRDTRAAILDEYNSFTVRVEDPPASPFDFIEDSTDRELLIQYLGDLDYLHEQLASAIEFNDMATAEEFSQAISQKGNQIENILDRWELPDPGFDAASMDCQPELWSGDWCTTYGTMSLSADGIAVGGRYTWDNGNINGILSEDGCTLSGDWFETPHKTDNDWGGFEFVLSGDDAWTGTWSYNNEPLGGRWNASRGAC